MYTLNSYYDNEQWHMNGLQRSMLLYTTQNSYYLAVWEESDLRWWDNFGNEMDIAKKWQGNGCIKDIITASESFCEGETSVDMAWSLL